MSPGNTRVGRISQPGVVGAVLAAALVVAACAPKTTPTVDLGTRLDCLRLRSLAVVAAHRGQPDQSAAENAISSFTASLAAGVPFLEMDVATTRDGALVLMHDDTLDRTTTGSGPDEQPDARGSPGAEDRAARRRRSRRTGADLRGCPRVGPVGWRLLRAGREAHHEVRRRGECGERRENDGSRPGRHLHARRREGRAHTRPAPDDLGDDGEAAGPGGGARRSSLSTACSAGRERASRRQRCSPRFARAGVEPIFGTLGRPGVRLDDVYAADGNLSEYPDLVRAGVVMIASDAAVAAQRAIGSGYRACFQ